VHKDVLITLYFVFENCLMSGCKKILGLYVFHRELIIFDNIVRNIYNNIKIREYV